MWTCGHVEISKKSRHVKYFAKNKKKIIQKKIMFEELFSWQNKQKNKKHQFVRK